MKVLSSSRILYMCSLILITSIAWYVVKLDVVNAYDVSTFYGAGNCQCEDSSPCPTPLCSAGTKGFCGQGALPSHYCVPNISHPCGSKYECHWHGTNNNCTIMN